MHTFMPLALHRIACGTAWQNMLWVWLHPGALFASFSLWFGKSVAELWRCKCARLAACTNAVSAPGDIASRLKS